MLKLFKRKKLRKTPKLEYAKEFPFRLSKVEDHNGLKIVPRKILYMVNNNCLIGNNERYFFQPNKRNLITAKSRRKRRLRLRNIVKTSLS